MKQWIRNRCYPIWISLKPIPTVEEKDRSGTEEKPSDDNVNSDRKAKPHATLDK